MAKTITSRCPQGQLCCHDNLGIFIGCYDPTKCQDCDPVKRQITDVTTLIEVCKECQQAGTPNSPTYITIDYCNKKSQDCCYGACYDKVCEICDHNTKKAVPKPGCAACCSGGPNAERASICYDPAQCEQCMSGGQAGFYVKDLKKRPIPGTLEEEINPCVKCENGSIVPECDAGSYCCECGSQLCCDGCEYCDRTDPNNPEVYDGAGCEPGIECCDGKCYDPADPQYKYCYECLTQPNSNPPKAKWLPKCENRTDGKTSCCNGTCYDPNGCKKCSSSGNFLENKEQAGWTCCVDSATGAEKFVPNDQCCGGILLGGTGSLADKCCNGQPYNSFDGKYDCCVTAGLGGGVYNTLSEGCCGEEKYSLSDKLCCDNQLHSALVYSDCCGSQPIKDYEGCCNGSVFSTKCQVCIKDNIYDNYNKLCYDCDHDSGLKSKLKGSERCCTKDGWSNYSQGDPGSGPYSPLCDDCDTTTGDTIKKCPDDEPDCCRGVQSTLFGGGKEIFTCWNETKNPCSFCDNGKIDNNRCKDNTNGKTSCCQFREDQNAPLRSECYAPGCEECDSVTGPKKKDCSTAPASSPITFIQNAGIPYYGFAGKTECCSNIVGVGQCFNPSCEACLNKILVAIPGCTSCCEGNCCSNDCCETVPGKYECCPDNTTCCSFDNGNKDCCKSGKCCPEANQCCSDSEHCTNGKCCPLGEEALGSNKVCCTPDRWCDPTCCSPGQVCCDGVCVSSDECCNGQVCSAGTICCGSSCQSPNECCGNEYFDPYGCKQCINNIPIDICDSPNGIKQVCCQGINGAPSQCYDPNQCEKCVLGVKVPYTPSQPDCSCVNGQEVCLCDISPVSWSFDESCSYCVNYGSGSVSRISGGTGYSLSGSSSSFTSSYSYPGNMLITISCSDGNDYVVWQGTSVPNGTLTGIPTTLSSNPCCP